MWQNPQRITNEGVILTLTLIMDKPLQPIKLIAPPDTDEAGYLITRWHNDVNTILSCCTPTDGPAFRLWFHAYVMTEVERIEREQLYTVIANVGLRWSNILHNVTEESGKICHAVASCVLALLGTERAMLVGIDDNKPVFKPIATIKKEHIQLYVGRLPVIVAGLMGKITANDIDMVPDFREFDARSLWTANEQRDDELFAKSSALIEEAFYKQRYIINPQGVYVRITGVDNLTGIYIKARTAKNQGSLMDILAAVQTRNGSFFTALTEERLLAADQKPLGISPGSRIIYLLCHIYRDLLVARDVPVAKAKKGSKRAASQHRALPGGGGYTVIPRRLSDGKTQSPRQAVPEPIISEPRRVEGYPRKGNMTPKQRAAILQFEQDYQVRILDFVPDGHTYVLSYMRPATTPEEFASLPRYIRHFTQQALIKGLRDRTE